MPKPVYGPDVSRDVAFEQLVAGNPYGVAPDVDVLALPRGARQLLDKTLEGKHTKRAQLEAIGALFVPGGGLDMQYDSMATGTAAETFATRRGNCLSYTDLFIAMARSRGLDARYREVLIVPRWEVAGDYVMLNRHIAAYGEFGRGGSYIADFGFLRESEKSFGRIVSDDRARAQYFNNLGARELINGNVHNAIRLFARGITIDPDLSYLWSNLGTAYLRDGDPARAEAALRQSVADTPWDAAALNQLMRLYQQVGRQDLAEVYRRRSEAAFRQNPYMQFEWAIQARQAGNLKKAEDYLRHAIRSVPGEMYFWLELAKVEVQRRDGRAAKSDLLKAEALARTVEQRKAVRATVDEVVKLSEGALKKPAPAR